MPLSLQRLAGSKVYTRHLSWHTLKRPGWPPVPQIYLQIHSSYMRKHCSEHGQPKHTFASDKAGDGPALAPTAHRTSDWRAGPHAWSAQARRTRGQVSCPQPLAARRPRPEDSRASQNLKETVTVFGPFLWQKCYLLKYSFCVESQWTDRFKSWTLNWKLY